jgi:hypothetical protein
MPHAIHFSPAAMMSELRRLAAAALARMGYGLFYLAVLGLLVGVPLGLGLLAWHFLG